MLETAASKVASLMRSVILLSAAWLAYIYELYHDVTDLG